MPIARFLVAFAAAASLLTALPISAAPPRNPASLLILSSASTPPTYQDASGAVHPCYTLENMPHEYWKPNPDNPNQNVHCGGNFVRGDDGHGIGGSAWLWGGLGALGLGLGLGLGLHSGSHSP